MEDKDKKEFKQWKDEAQKALDDMPSVHKFVMVNECTDKNGELTKVLLIDTDCDGFLGLLMDIGKPYTFSVEPNVSADERIIKNTGKFSQYFHEMSNIDLRDKVNAKAVGAAALAKAQSVLEDFFTLFLVSATSIQGEED